MKKIYALTVSAFFLSTLFVSAKKLVAPDKQVGTELKLGDVFYAESYFYTAAEHYREVVRQDSANRYGNFWLAMSLLQARDYENAEVFFRQFYSIKPGEKANMHKWEQEDKVLFNKGEYYFGVVLHRNGKYDEALEHLNKFEKTYSPLDPKDTTDHFKKLAAIEIAGCEFAKTGPHAKVKVYNAGPGVNKAYNDEGPFGVSENELYYTSTKPGTGNSLIFVGAGAKGRPAVYEVYHSTREGKEWGPGQPVDNKDINTDGYNVGNGTFNRSLTRFYFTKCLTVDDNRPLCNIFVADYNNGKFSNVARVTEPTNSKEQYTSTQPTVRSADDGTEIIYFSSDRPGGSGGLDIWYTTRLSNGDFKPAEHVKGPINTPGDEITPFFDDSTKTLYFSSNGLPGYGGFDIFKSSETPDLTWTDPLNLGKPLNSGADDLYYSKGLDETDGYLVSNRDGSVPLNDIKTASDDIWYWTNFRYAVEGTAMKEGEDGGTLTNATFKLYKKMPDGSKVLVSVQDPSKSPALKGVKNSGAGGNYFFKLEPESDYVVEVDREGFQPKTENITTKGLPDEDTIRENIMTRKGIVTVKGTVTEEGKPDVTVKDANVELVQVYPDGLEQTQYIMKSNPYVYFDLELGKNYKLVTRKEGYFANTVPLNTAGITSTDTIRKDITLAKLEMNKAYTLQNVLYEFAKSTLTENSKAVLDNLYQILVENPSFVIELSSHTDGIGSDAGNMKLSQARAESCVRYLISKGISKDRLVAKGYGKTRPKVPNTTADGKDDPAGRAINRRTEFQIIGQKNAQ